MAESTLPYLNAYGNISKGLRKIKEASTPDRFTQDFLATKLGLSGGSAKPLIPFLKRTGFLGSDGSPTALYTQFRGGPAQSGAAAAAALKTGYRLLYESNEYAHALNDAELKDLVVQVTGASKTSSTVRAIVSSFKALNEFADHEAQAEDSETAPAPEENVEAPALREALSNVRFGYTINLHLPATSDVAVFNAIFKSLREHLQLQ